VAVIGRIVDRLARSLPRAATVAVPVALLTLVALPFVIVPTPAPAPSLRLAPPLSTPGVAPPLEPDAGWRGPTPRASGRGFLRGYLDFSSGRVRLSEIEYASPTVLRAVERRPARGRRPRIIALRIVEQAPAAVQATAIAGDGRGRRQRLVVYLDRRARGWTVVRVGDD
jgi:hypothetical protein